MPPTRSRLRARANGEKDLKKNFEKDGFSVNVKQLVDFQEDYGLKGEEGEEEDEDEDEDMSRSEGSEESDEE